MSAFDAYVRLEGTLGGSVVCDEPMARHTTYRIGGPAALFVTCDSIADLSLTLDVLAEEEVPWTVVGKGSNLLVSDEGYEGAVIVLGKEFCKQDFGEAEVEGQDTVLGEDAKPVIVTAGAGCVFSRLVQKAFGCSLSGFEFAVGIPGTLGGALRMNAGTREHWIGSVVDSVTTYVPGEGLKRRRGDEVSWNYRWSGIPANEIILEATLRLQPASQMRMRAKMEASRKRRQNSQPLDKASCGSVFRNPEGESAARLIAGCGLQGMVCGDAQVSEKHANFIVNRGSAKAADVLELIQIVRSRVKENYAIELKPEVRFLGFAQ